MNLNFKTRQGAGYLNELGFQYRPGEELSASGPLTTVLSNQSECSEPLVVDPGYSGPITGPTLSDPLVATTTPAPAPSDPPVFTIPSNLLQPSLPSFSFGF